MKIQNAECDLTELIHLWGSTGGICINLIVLKDSNSLLWLFIKVMNISLGKMTKKSREPRDQNDVKNFKCLELCIETTREFNVEGHLLLNNLVYNRIGKDASTGAALQGGNGLRGPHAASFL